MQENKTENLTTIQLDTVVKLTTKLHELGLTANFTKPVSTGPIVSVFRFVPTGGTKVSQIEALAPDFAVFLGVEDVMVKRLPGESAVAVFVPNTARTLVKFIDTASRVWLSKANVPINLGVDYLGVPFVEDLSQLPHLLIAGSTGSGKSTLLGSIIASLLNARTPEQIQFVLSDTKGVEFGHFVGAPHLLFEPATTVYQTLERLDWVIDEMEDRLKKLSKAGCRNVFEYHQLTEEPIPFIVVVIDELADLLRGEKRGEKKLAEDKLSQIVQKSRATGVYVIASTQRPSVDVITGSIKANFPARLSFRLPTDSDSRTVLGTSGAEHLLSTGDMLYSSPNKPGITRLHAPYARITDIKAAVEAAVRR